MRYHFERDLLVEIINLVCQEYDNYKKNSKVVPPTENKNNEEFKDPTKIMLSGSPEVY